MSNKGMQTVVNAGIRTVGWARGFHCGDRRTARRSGRKFLVGVAVGMEATSLGQLVLSDFRKCVHPFGIAGEFHRHDGKAFGSETNSLTVGIASKEGQFV